MPIRRRQLHLRGCSGACRQHPSSEFGSARVVCHHIAVAVAFVQSISNMCIPERQICKVARPGRRLSAKDSAKLLALWTKLTFALRPSMALRRSSHLKTIA